MKTNIILILSIVLIIAITRCEKDAGKTEYVIDTIKKDKYYESEILSGTYHNFYGKWKLYGVSGGFAGSGHDLNFDFLEIKEFGIYGFIRNDSVIEFGKIKIEEQKDNALLISFVPDEGSETFMHDAEKYVNFCGQDTLSLDSPCCDRYNYHFNRVK